MTKEYPVREILFLIDSQTGKTVELEEGCDLLRIENVNAHTEHFLTINSPRDLNIRITYRYGYVQHEVPSLLRLTKLDMMRDRLICTGKIPQEEIEDMDKSRMMQLKPFQRIYEW